MSHRGRRGLLERRRSARPAGGGRAATARSSAAHQSPVRGSGGPR